jgi:hypothetical protein
VESVAALHRLRRLAALAGFALIAGCGSPERRDDAAVVTSVLAALASSRLETVAGEFAPEARDQIADRVHTGILSRQLVPLGELQHVALRPAQAGTPVERFDATFANGTRVVDVAFDRNGKIAAFWVH